MFLFDLDGNRYLDFFQQRTVFEENLKNYFLFSLFGFQLNRVQYKSSENCAFKFVSNLLQKMVQEVSKWQQKLV